MTTGSALIIGATSDIGRALGHRFAAAGHSVQLTARGTERLSADRADMELRHAVSISVHELDILATDTFEDFIEQLPVLPSIVICVVGLLGNQPDAETDLDFAQRVLRSNFEGPALLLGLLANRFAERGSGTLVGISSVAGERGRASNYVYGSAKAGFSAFLSGLRNRLHGTDIDVVTVLPGFVATKMTEDMDLPRRLTTTPEKAADAIFAAVSAREDVIYIKPIWRLIMAIIRALPEWLFKRTRM